MDVIDTFLATFIAYIDSGFGLLAGDVAYLSSTLIAIDITLAGLFWALNANTDVVGALIRKVLYVGFFAFIIGNFAVLANIIFDSFADLGLRAGGSTLTAADLFRPGFIATVGLDAATPLLEEIGDMLGPIAFFENFILIAVMLVAWAVIIVSFFILAVQLFITILEFKLTTLAGFILVPFALWNRTTFLAERVLGNVITSGVKLMVLAVIIGIGSTLFASVTDAFRTGGDITLAAVMGAVLASLAFFWMGLFAPGIASGLITGAPQLGAGSAAGATAGVAAGAYVTGMAARGAVGSLARGASTALQSGASMAGGAGALRRKAAAPLRSLGDAYRRGSQSAWTATGGSPVGAASAASEPPTPSPGWARRMQAQQRMSHARQMAAHSLKEGDRSSGGAAPSLQHKDD